MHRLALAALLNFVVCGALAGVAPAQDAAAPATMPARTQSDVPVTEVALFNTGVGFFKHSGKIAGDAYTELHFKRDQINDILKSLVLQDRDGGHIGTVVYPSQDPVEHTLHRFQVDISSDPPLELLLQQLRGARVRLAGTDPKLEGQIIGLQQKERTVKDGTAARALHPWYINILSGASIHSVSLDDVGNIELLDPELQKDFTAALTTLAKTRDQDKKTVTVNFDGAGQRGVAFAYLLETPIWKTSYRLILPEVGPDGKPQDAKAQPILQAWALVENQTDADWTGVKLSLMGGHPISFLQNLYESLYVPRPVYEANFTGALNPQTYEGGSMVRGGGQSVMPPTFNLQTITQNGQSGGASGGGGGQGIFQDTNAPSNGGANGAAAQRFNPAQGITADTDKLGDKFEYVIDRVSLHRGQSAMLPVLNDPVEAQRISIYNAAVLSKNPLYGARLKNTTGKYLLEGPLTVVQSGNYAGDALLGNTSPGKSRLLTYGADQDLRIEPQQETTSAIQGASIIKARLVVTYKTVTTTNYQIKSTSDMDKTLLIEHPSSGSVTERLLEPREIVEKTDALYRLECSVPARKAVTLKAVVENVNTEAIVLASLSVDQLQEHYKNGGLPQDVRDVLAEIIKRHAELTKAEATVTEKTAERAQIAVDQQRIRDNIKVADHKDKIYDRLETKLNDQETQLETLDKEIKDAQAALKQAQEDLQQYVETPSGGKGRRKGGKGP